MKKLLKYLGLPVLLLSLLLVPALSVRAEGTTPMKVESHTTNQIIVSWPGVTGATAYYYGIGKSADEALTDLNGMQHYTTDVKAQFDNLTPGTSYVISVKYATGTVKTIEDLKDYYKNLTVITTPATPTNVRATYWSYSMGILRLEWDIDGNAAGYEVVITDSEGEKTTKYVTEKKIELDTDEAEISYFNVKVRAYILDPANQNTKIFGSYSDTYKSFAQPQLKETEDGYAVTIKNKKLTVEWWYERNADGYEIRVAKKKNGPYKTVKTINSKKTEKGTAAKYNGKRFNPKSEYWVTVRAFRNDNGKKTYTSESYVVYYRKGETFMTLKK